jgi:hypothetical protein
VVQSENRTHTAQNMILLNSTVVQSENRTHTAQNIILLNITVVQNENSCVGNNGKCLAGESMYV